MTRASSRGTCLSNDSLKNEVCSYPVVVNGFELSEIFVQGGVSFKGSNRSITAALIPRSLLRKELFSDPLESVIPECFYRESRTRPELDPRLPPLGLIWLSMF